MLGYYATTAISSLRRSKALAALMVLVILQLWLITATMNAYLGGDHGVVWPAAGASFVCLLLNLGLLKYVYGLER